MSKVIRIKEILNNSESNILFLASLSDKELSKRLDTIHLQMELAEQNRNTDSLELLELWRGQLIEARIYKAENEIEDAPNEIEIAIADIETVVAKAEERQEIIESSQTSHKIHKPKIKEEDKNQISLF